MAMDRRTALMDAAERAILRDGFAGASTRGIAAEAGAPLSLLHYHFGGKEGLLLAVTERARSRLRQTVLAALSETGPGPLTANVVLAAACAVLTAEGDAGRLLLELSVAALHSDPLRAEVQRFFQEATAAVTALVRSLAGDDADDQTGAAGAESLALLLIAAGSGLALHQALTGESGQTRPALEALIHLIAGHRVQQPAISGQHERATQPPVNVER